MNTKTFTASALRIAPIAAANGVTAARQILHIKTGLRVSRPNMIYVMLNNRCNLRCQYCDIWRNKGETDLSGTEWIRVFDELLSWAPHPKLNISGGEPFIHRNIFEILDFCVTKGAITGVVTNGWPITPEMAPRVVDIGLANLNISLDSLTPETSDFMRGRPGHTERVLKTILGLLEEIQRRRSNMKIYLKTVVCGTNAHDLIPLVEFARKHGIAGVTFQPLEAVFSRHVDHGNSWFAHTPLWPENPKLLDEVSEQLAVMKRNGAPITNPLSHIERWGAYFRNPVGSVEEQLGGDQPKLAGDGSVERVPCRIGYSHLYINADGTFKLCWSLPRLGDAKVDSIPEKWNSAIAKQLRDDIASCTATCTKTCLLDRGFGETVKTFMRLMKPHVPVATSDERIERTGLDD